MLSLMCSMAAGARNAAANALLFPSRLLARLTLLQATWNAHGFHRDTIVGLILTWNLFPSAVDCYSGLTIGRLLRLFRGHTALPIVFACGCMGRGFSVCMRGRLFSAAFLSLTISHGIRVLRYST